MNLEENFLAIPKQCVELCSDEIEMVEQLAAVGFDVEKIARVLEKDVRLFKRDFFTAGTPIFSAYHKGLLLAKNMIDSVLFENAQKGNLTAMQQYYKNLEETKCENIRQEIFNND